MANEMRDRLVELVQDALFQHAHYVAKERRRALEAETEAEHSEIYESIKTLHEYVADHLIENGVVVPPCKVGQAVYMLFEGEITPLLITSISIIETVGEFSRCYDATGKNVATSFTDNHIGKTMFLTKAEAEQKLKEMRDSNG